MKCEQKSESLVTLEQFLLCVKFGPCHHVKTKVIDNYGTIQPYNLYGCFIVERFPIGTVSIVYIKNVISYEGVMV